MERRADLETPTHTVSVEFEFAGERPIGSVAFDGGRPARFEGFDELERMIASIPSTARPLVLVRAEDALPGEDGLTKLTAREREIAVAAASGATNREIAASKYYSVKSIEAYLTRVYRKLAISGRDELAALVTDDVEDLPVSDAVGDELTGGSRGAPSPAVMREGRRGATVQLLVHG
jgi:DNA-binding CsgD family transcriptional regulator